MDPREHYIVKVERSRLDNLKVWDDQGNILFDSDGFEGLGMAESRDEFLKESEKMLDLETPENPILANFFRISKNGVMEKLDEALNMKAFFLPYSVNELGHFRCFERAS